MGSMTTASRIAILCIPIILFLLLITQFDMLHREHFLSFVPVFPNIRSSHPDVILSDPGGPLLVSMAELVMLPPPVLPQLTCAPPPLPRLEAIPSQQKLPSDPKVIFEFVQLSQLHRLPWPNWWTSCLPTLHRHDDAFRIWGENADVLLELDYVGASGWYPGNLTQGAIGHGWQVFSQDFNIIFVLLENDFEVVPGGSHCDPQRPSKASDVGTPQIHPKICICQFLQGETVQNMPLFGRIMKPWIF